nr:hypothetical protein [Kibdelosporangium sp. MJ126-NF4]
MKSVSVAERVERSPFACKRDAPTGSIMTAERTIRTEPVRVPGR